MTFLKVADVSEFCKNVWAADVNLKHVEWLISLSLLPVFKRDRERFLLRNDLSELLPVLRTMSIPDAVDILTGSLFSEALSLSRNCRIETVAGERTSPTFCAAARNLIHVALRAAEESSIEPLTVSYFPPTRVSTSSPTVCRYISEQKDRAQMVDTSYTNDFAGSAHYMGSKRSLSGFVIEAISQFLPPHGVAVDLMCGSGAASRAFSRIWRTFSSDLQAFCTHLALIQGGGFSKNRAGDLIQNLLPIARSHANDLRNNLREFIDFEDKLLHGDIGPALLAEYRHFLTYLPTYPSEARACAWFPKFEVEKRKENPKIYPYCLFSAYYANIYFGVRQCVEIDSLRFAIDQIESSVEQRWALGALITTISAIGTTYAAHFAQPRIKDANSLRLEDLPILIEQRAYSVMHEFTVRLMNLAEESENASNPVEIVPGPWEKALSHLDNLISNEPVLVYVDAPYKREEYSRYYHVLETLIAYSYPQSIGKGRVPEKGSKERPYSEFFTRSQSGINQLFVRLISAILARGWNCAWSYASSGDADIMAVLSEIGTDRACQIKCYATPYEHRPQGKGKVAKKVTEYVMVFSP